MNDERKEQGISALTQTLLGIANATFAARVPRTYTGDDADVLAFLVNSTADEVEILFRELEIEREQLRQAQAQLVHAEKLAALGRLAAGVAHQMNQPLTVISGLVDLILMDADAGVNKHRNSLQMVAEASRQMSAIVDSIRTFGRRDPSRKKLVPALEPVLSAHQLFASELDAAGVQFEWPAPQDLPLILAELDQLRQAFINLIANARDAVRGRPVRDGSPRIRLSVSTDGRDVLYRIEDNGPGVRPEHIPQLFEPFFTTKGGQTGTGLGLSVALGVIEEHGGDISYAASGLGGACFVVRLPRAEDVS